MIKKLLLSILLLPSIIGYSQKGLKIKFKKEANHMQYSYLPEYLGYDKHETFDVDFEYLGLPNERSQAVTPSKPQNRVSLTVYHYLNNHTYDENGSLKIEIRRVGHSESAPQLKKTSEKKTRADGTTYNAPIYYYNLNFTDEYQIIAKDQLKDGAIIFDKRMSYSGTTEYPRMYGSQAKYSTEKALRSAYLSIDHSLRRKKEIESVIKNDLKRDVNKWISIDPEVIGVRYWNIKVKDDRFEELTQANELLATGLQIVNDNKKEGVYLNWHAKEAFDYFEKAYHIYKKFNTAEYVDVIDKKMKEEYRYKLRYCLFNTALFTSRYEEATALAEQTVKERDAGAGTKKKGLVGGLMKDALSDVKAIFKIDSPKGFLSAVDQSLLLMAREIKLFKAHSEYYSFYK